MSDQEMIDTTEKVSAAVEEDHGRVREQQVARLMHFQEQPLTAPAKVFV